MRNFSIAGIPHVSSAHPQARSSENWELAPRL